MGKIKVFIDGQAGTTGLKIKERLLARSDVQLIVIEEALRKEPIEKAKLINNSDVVFLCLPDSASIESARLVTNKNTILIDASTAHRTNSDWDYGFAELDLNHRNAIKNSKRIAVPGCHASGFLSIVYPLVKSGIINNEAQLTATSLTGYSGGGKQMIAEYEMAKEDEIAMYTSPRHYALGQTHKHLKEMKAVANLKIEPIFSPIVCNYFAGMNVSIPLTKEILTKNLSSDEIRDCLIQWYKDSYFVNVSSENPQFLGALENTGSNKMTLHVSGNGERTIVYSVFDNLGKGASGAAMQCMNIALGLDEKEGLI